MSEPIEIPEDQYPMLPKWPGVYVTGKRVTPEQAKDIIMRTDGTASGFCEYSFGNDKRFGERCVRDFGWEPFINAQNGIYAAKTEETRTAAWANLAQVCAPYDTLYDIRDAWKKEMAIIETEYVYNRWLASAYIFGPTGWCHPDGTIQVDGHNYGKYPGVSDIAHEWELLAEAFPYLDLACTLQSEEAHSDNIGYPVVTILVKGGKVRVCKPDLSLHEPKARHVKEASMTDAVQMILMHPSFREQGWSREWIEEFCERSKAAIARVKLHTPIKEDVDEDNEG